jgi:hypothetical protein
MDKIVVSEMTDTKYDVMTSIDHKVVLVQVNEEEIYLYSAKEAREYGEALITAADKLDEAAKPVIATIKTA